MPLNISDLANERRKLEIELKNVGILQISYRPNVLTPAREASLRRMAEEEDANPDGEEDTTSQLLIDLIETWDMVGPLYADTGKGIDAQHNGDPIVGVGMVVPLEPKYLAHIPSRIQLHILRQIGKDANPDPNGRGRSGVRSRRED